MSLKIDVMKERLLNDPNFQDGQDFEIRHVEAEGQYAKRIELPSGAEALQHSHNYDHISILASGSAWVTVDDETVLYTGPTEIVIQKDKIHGIKAVSDIVWYCIHNTEVALWRSSAH